MLGVKSLFSILVSQACETKYSGFRLDSEISKLSFSTSRVVMRTFRRKALSLSPAPDVALPIRLVISPITSYKIHRGRIYDHSRLPIPSSAEYQNKIQQIR